MKRPLILLVLFFCSNISNAQQKDHYIDSIKTYRKNYIETHEVVKKEDKKYFRFFPVNSGYNISCQFLKVNDSIGFTMKTSANTLQHYFKYGSLQFDLNGSSCRLLVYQSSELMKTEKYKDYLFIPFTDLSTGHETYGSGRYLEFFKNEIKGDLLQLDFNKAYNPYCAYSTGFHCPIPPRENHLSIAVKAGEKTFAKAH